MEAEDSLPCTQGPAIGPHYKYDNPICIKFILIIAPLLPKSPN